MHNRIKIIIAAVVSVLALTIISSTASAHRSIEVRGLEAGGNVTAEGRLKFGEFSELANFIECNVTLRRTVARLIPKITGTLFGKVTAVQIQRNRAGSRRCNLGGGVTELNEIQVLQEERRAGTHRELGTDILLYDVSRAPGRLWKLIYLSFQGTLPRITGINFRISGAQFLLGFTAFGVRLECLYNGNQEGLIRINERGVITGAEAVLVAIPPLRENSFLCPAEGALSGTFTVRPTLTIALI